MAEVFFSARSRYSAGLYETDGTAGGTKRIGTYADFDNTQIGSIYGTATGAFVVSFAVTNSDADIDYFSPHGHRLSRTHFANGSLEETYSDGNLFYYHEYRRPMGMAIPITSLSPTGQKPARRT